MSHHQRSGHMSHLIACSGLAAAVLTGACDTSSTTAPSTTSGGASRVKLEAMVTGRSGSCPAIRFNLGGIRVETSALTQFALSCDRIVDGAPVQADATRMIGDVLTAREVETGDESISDPDFEAEGAIETLSSPGDCTSSGGRTVTIAGLSLRASSFTDFRDLANGCSGLTAGTRVRARGPLSNPPTAPALPLRATRVDKR